jgi:hypothetical protein
MNEHELEDLYIRALDFPMSTAEKAKFLTALKRYPALPRQLIMHDKIRELASTKEPATFGPYFAAKLVHKIEQTGVVIDRQIFSFFKRFQLAAVGVVVALLILNMVFADQTSLKSIFGLDRTATQDEEIVSFDFSEILNNDL